MPSNPGKNKTNNDSFYVHAPRSKRNAHGGARLVSPGVMEIVAWRYECGEHPHDIAVGMGLPRAAVADIIATYEHRAELYFKITRRRA